MGWSRDGRYYQGRSALFQSLRGFGVGWSHIESPFDLGGQVVSIPERVWGGLEHRQHRFIPSVSRFQSLRGFGVGWSVRAEDQR